MSKLDEYWFPWYPSAFQRDTMHLSALQDGIYRRLLDHYMLTKTALPHNNAALARISGVSIEIFSENAQEIVKLFNEIKDEKAIARLQQSRCEAVLRQQTERSAIYRANGKTGAAKKAQKKANENKDDLAIAKQTASTRQDKTRQDSIADRESLKPNNPLKPPLPPETENGRHFKPSVSEDGRRFSIERKLSDAGRERAKLLCKSLNRDIYPLFQIYDKGINEGSREPPKAPDAAFYAWIGKYTKGQNL